MEIDRARVAALAAQAAAANMAQGRLRGQGASAPSGDALAPTLDSLSVDELQRLRDEIDKRLPENSLASLNLESELVEQYRTVKRLQDDVINDSEVAPNQRAQVANSVVATLQQLVKLQEDLRRGETMKLMESVFIDVLKQQPKAVSDAFFAEYETQASKAGLMS